MVKVTDYSSCARSRYGVQDTPTIEQERAMTINHTAPGTTPPASSPANLRASPKWFAALGLVAGFGAVVASSCCAIPLGLAALGAGAGVLGGFEAIA
jgi:mercuric ion transport protein